MPSPDNCVLISAGGYGGRLWPLSRRSQPKQFQRFFGERTLLQHMVDLVLSTVPLDQIYILTTPPFKDIVQVQLPDLPIANIFLEPEQRDNGPAITLAMLKINERHPDRPVAILWADHLIKDAAAFAVMLRAAFAAADAYPERMVLMGVKPTSADTGLGYIEMDEEVGRFADQKVFSIKRFVEKPDLKTAQKMLDSWEYLWNTGYKVVRPAYFLESLGRVQPDLVPILDRLKKDENAYKELPKLSIEYLYTQYLTDLLVVPTDIGWSDVGNWNVLHEMLKNGIDVVTQGQVVQLDCKNSLLIAGKTRILATMGVEDLIIVDHDDVLLVMPKTRAQEIKQLVNQLESSHPELL